MIYQLENFSVTEPPPGQAVGLSRTMVVILDGSSAVEAHVRSNLGYLTCLRHLIESSHKSDFLYFISDLFSLVRAHHVLSYHGSYIRW